MRTKYSITIFNSRKKAITLMSSFIMIIAALLLAYVGGLGENNKLVFYAAVVIVATILNHFVRTDKFNLKPFALMFLVIGWWVAGYPWISCFFILMSYLEYEAKKDKAIEFKDTFIKQPGLFGRTIKWFELNNAMVKDGLLTIDFKNDRLIQAEIMQEESDIENESDFNEWCRQRVNEHAFIPSNEQRPTIN